MMAWQNLMGYMLTASNINQADINRRAEFIFANHWHFNATIRLILDEQKYTWKRELIWNHRYEMTWKFVVVIFGNCDELVIAITQLVHDNFFNEKNNGWFSHMHIAKNKWANTAVQLMPSENWETISNGWNVGLRAQIKCNFLLPFRITLPNCHE